MIYTAEEFLSRSLRHDICIIGGGPTGICLALELLYSNLSVVVLEGGQLTADPFFDGLKNADASAHPLKSSSRERLFGGSSKTWAGRLAPLDPIDFEDRPGLHPGWPIPISELADAINASGHRYNLPAWRAFDKTPLMSESWISPNGATIEPKIFLEQIPPLRFGEKFKYAFTRSGLDLVLGAAATTLDTSSCVATSVSSVRVQTRTGSEGQVKATIFVLAAGGIENVRLLLNSRDCRGHSLGDHCGRLGRGFMNHPKGYVAALTFRTSVPISHPLFQIRRGQFSGYVGLRLSDPALRASGLLNPYVRLMPCYIPPREDPQLEAGMQILRVARSALQQLRARRFLGAINDAAKAATMVGAYHQAIIALWRTLKIKRTLRVRHVILQCHVDIDPSLDNYIKLSSERDSLGALRAHVNHDFSTLSLKSVDALIGSIDAQMQGTSLGTIKRFAGPLQELLTTTDSSHHLGGASMGRDEKNSVVDPNLKVHGIDNLYVAGGAVFPTGGSANPTLTMLALSIRVAARLKGILGAESVPPRPIAQGSAGVVIVGAGRRVAEDVVPVVEALDPSAHIVGIYATRPGAIFGQSRVWDVQPLSTIEENVIRSARVVYVAVPLHEIPRVIASLRKFDCKHLSLILDTPAIQTKALLREYQGFHEVHVAEDSVRLPWLEAVHANLGIASGASTLREIWMNQSAFRYHAVALAKAVAYFEIPDRYPVIRFGFRLGRASFLKFGNGATARILEPRDYTKGQLDIVAMDGRTITSKSGEELSINCLCDDELCYGFRVGAHEVKLTPTETRLVGRFTKTDTVVTRMLELKRVGLLSLVRDIIDGNSSYSLQHALEDSHVDSALRRRLYYRG